MDKWLKEFGDFEIITWELKTPRYFLQQSTTDYRVQICLVKIKKIIKLHQPDMVIERNYKLWFSLPLYL
jgi:hypothetical protein